MQDIKEVNAVDMQKTGFVQIPVLEFLNLTESVKEYEKLYNKVEAEKRERESLNKKLFTIKGYSSATVVGGQNIIVTVEEVLLYEYLGIGRLIAENIKPSLPNDERVVVTHIETHIRSSYDENMKLLKEVNS